MDFNPRTPCGVRHYHQYQHSDQSFQSTHPLRGATCSAFPICASCRFQSTHPLRGATNRLSSLLAPVQNFNPRTPCGVRRCHLVYDWCCKGYFNPRTPCGVRLYALCKERDIKVISIHAPLAGCDYTCQSATQTLEYYFNPRTPCGVRQSVTCRFS